MYVGWLPPQVYSDIYQQMESPDYADQGYTDVTAILDGSVLTITINPAQSRPKEFSGNLFKNLLHVFDLCDRDDRVRVVILTADPSAPSYCSGGDISGGWDSLWDAESEKEGEHAHRDAGGILSILIYNCRKITIAAVNGHAAGIGMTVLQLPFDFRFVWAGAKLVFPFVRRGIVPEATSSYLLPRLVGPSRANSLLLTGAVVRPDSPYIKELYHEIIPTREAVYPTAKAFAAELAVNTSQISIAYSKGLLQHNEHSIEESHLLESRAMRLSGSSVDATEGFMSFKERRPPKFNGALSKDLSPWFPWWRRIDIGHRKSKL